MASHPRRGRKNSPCIPSQLAEGRGFEPPVGLRLRLISSQVPLTTQPPFHKLIRRTYFARIRVHGKLILKSLKTDRLSMAKPRLADLESFRRRKLANDSRSTQ